MRPDDKRQQTTTNLFMVLEAFRHSPSPCNDAIISGVPYLPKDEVWGPLGAPKRHGGRRLHLLQVAAGIYEICNYFGSKGHRLLLVSRAVWFPILVRSSTVLYVLHASPRQNSRTLCVAAPEFSIEFTLLAPLPTSTS